MSGDSTEEKLIYCGDVVKLTANISSPDSGLIAMSGEDVTVLSFDKNGWLVERMDGSKSFYVDENEITK